MKDGLMLAGIALIAYNVYEIINAPMTGTGTDDDPIRVQTHSPMLALIGFVLILKGTSHG